MNIITQLEDLNWTPYTNRLNSADHSYEFWVKFNGIKLYTVHCDVYNMTEYGRGLDHQYSVQFNTSNGQVFNVELLGCSPEEALMFFDEMYEKMDCVPYD